jgi:hypothetical protein
MSLLIVPLLCPDRALSTRPAIVGLLTFLALGILRQHARYEANR